ncbi:MAG: DUF3006 domain-containing protein [Proteobacteria bacterium]|jgi:hypothetical protein|nr:DUF3006 domain-containing protein [Pseudomonadota bacterium]
MKLQIVVDRIEGDLAVLEVGNSLVDWPLKALPPEVAEGTCLTIEIQVDPSDTRAAEERLARLRRREPKGDVIDL